MDCTNQGIFEESGKRMSVLGRSTYILIVIVEVGCVRDDGRDSATSSLGCCG